MLTSIVASQQLQRNRVGKPSADSKRAKPTDAKKHGEKAKC